MGQLYLLIPIRRDRYLLMEGPVEQLTLLGFFSYYKNANCELEVKCTSRFRHSLMRYFVPSAFTPKVCTKSTKFFWTFGFKTAVGATSSARPKHCPLGITTSSSD
ncbi:unnamed protein product [Nezara viridula]|uniref:Uncharacterized protein n=1 Tax=Nezara viridula TaxID=85310 RepID=A0A9P0H6W4_NEZVI|nr:unnamed protein product [Nezara viridula]